MRPCSFQTSHLFLQRFLPSGGHLGRRRALTGASFQQVDPGWSRALLVLEIEQHILVKGKELLVPPAVLRRLLRQVSTLRPLFTRDDRQKQRVPFVVAHALLHFLTRFRRSRKVGEPELSSQAHGRVELFPTERRAAQRLRGARKSCRAAGCASAEELILQRRSPASPRVNPCCHKTNARLKKK